MFDLTGKVAIVTGASRGIGEVIAMALSQAGAAVALTSRKLENVAPVADKIQAAGGRALALQAQAPTQKLSSSKPWKSSAGWMWRSTMPLPTPLRPHPDCRREPVGQNLRGQCQGLLLPG
jgi:hypothetical protein